MFELPKYVLQSGVLIAEEGEIRAEHYGKTLHVAPSYDPAVEASIREWFEQFYTVQFRNYPVWDDYVPHGEIVG
jgi:formylmethanofuran dehydrogenase subunit A